VGEREILETYSNSVSKNSSETDIFPHGPKSLLTSVIITCGSCLFGGCICNLDTLVGVIPVSLVGVSCMLEETPT